MLKQDEIQEAIRLFSSEGEGSEWARLVHRFLEFSRAERGSKAPKENRDGNSA